MTHLPLHPPFLSRHDSLSHTFSTDHFLIYNSIHSIHPSISSQSFRNSPNIDITPLSLFLSLPHTPLSFIALSDTHSLSFSYQTLSLFFTSLTPPFRSLSSSCLLFFDFLTCDLFFSCLVLSYLEAITSSLNLSHCRRRRYVKTTFEKFQRETRVDLCLLTFNLAICPSLAEVAEEYYTTTIESVATLRKV